MRGPIEWIQQNRGTSWKPGRAGEAARALVSDLDRSRQGLHVRVACAIRDLRSPRFHERCRFAGIRDGRVWIEVEPGQSPDLARMEWHPVLRRALQEYWKKGVVSAIEFRRWEPSACASTTS